MNEQQVSVRSVQNPRKVDFKKEGVATAISVWDDDNAITTHLSGRLTKKHLLVMLKLLVVQASKHCDEAIHDPISEKDILGVLKIMVENGAGGDMLKDAIPMGEA